MKRLLLIFGLFSLSVPADPEAYHEFVVFGKGDKIYMSHFPMFHAVHAYQAIIEVSLSKDGEDFKETLSADRAAHPSRTYIVSPAKKGSPNKRRRADWELPKHMHAGLSFNTDVHWGYSDDDFLARDVLVKVDKVIHFRRFLENDKRNEQLTYVLFGTPNDYYLAHYVTTPADFIDSFTPDYDQIVSVDLLRGKLMPEFGFTKFTIGRKDVPTSRLRKKGEKVSGTFYSIKGPGTGEPYPALDSGKDTSGPSGTVEFKVNKEVYYSELEEQP